MNHTYVQLFYKNVVKKHQQVEYLVDICLLVNSSEASTKCLQHSKSLGGRSSCRTKSEKRLLQFFN